MGSSSHKVGNFCFSLLVMVFSKTINLKQAWAVATKYGCRSRFWSHRVLPGSPKTLRPYLWWTLPCLTGDQTEICRAESPVHGPLMVGLTGVSHAQIVLFYGWGRKSFSAHFFLFPGLTRSNPKARSRFQLCLHCLARKRGLISATKDLSVVCAEVGSHIWDLPKSYIILS